MRGAGCAEWVASLQAADLPPEARHQLRRAIMDGLGAAIAGSVTRTARIAARFARQMGGDGPATLLATGERLALPPAVFANGVAANALDIDDGYRPVKGHPGAFLIMPAIGAAEAGDPEALLPAIAAGYEIATRAGIATHRAYHHYHASGSWGALGTAACLGRMAGLAPEPLRWAFGLAEYHAPIAPIERCLAHPAMTKDAIAWGAFAGACAVDLAARGFTGNPSLLDDPANADLFADLGARWRLLDLYFKPYAACRWAQPAVDGVLRLQATHGITCDEIERIVVHTFREAAELPRSLPTTSEEAQYHLAWPIAAALRHGEVGPRQVAEEALGDEATCRVAARVEAVAEPEIQARFPEEALAWVEITTRDGRRLRGDLIPAAGDPGTPLSDATLDQKFLWLTEPVLGDGAAALRDAVWGVDRPGGPRALVESVTELVRRGPIPAVEVRRAPWYNVAVETAMWGRRERQRYEQLRDAEEAGTLTSAERIELDRMIQLRIEADAAAVPASTERLQHDIDAMTAAVDRLEEQNRHLRAYLAEREAFCERVRSVVDTIRSEDREMRERYAQVIPLAGEAPTRDPS